VFLVPRRRDNGPRDAIWEYAKARWQRYHPDVAIVEGHHDEGLFNRSAAVNRASEAAGDWDVAVVIDSDVILNQTSVDEAIDRALSLGKVTWAHRRWRGIREDATTRIIADRRDFGPEISRDEVDLICERTNPISWSCCIAIPRPVFDDMGGFDERFEGWGFEDMAFQSLVVGLYGHERVEGDVIHLWHPRSEERIEPGKGRLTATREYAVNARLGRRYMVAVRRDHGLTDRHTATDAAEMERDIANLVRDDAKWTETSKRHRLPDWSEWWPTLEELRDGAKAHRMARTIESVTLVVHTGGEPETWDDRVAYLRTALASLNERVSGPIVQRVIYSDWGGYRLDALNDLAAQHGFYVVGPVEHLGYSKSTAAMWRYLRERAKGRFIFAVEDDFTYDRDVDLVPMIRTLEENPHLKQLALLRHAAYASEFAAGGVLESLKSPTTLRNGRPFPFVEHRDHWTANPSLFRRTVTQTPWPSKASSERAFGDLMLRDKAAAFAYWGSGEAWITHIGETRASTSY
jgi:hypothetical protein